MRESDRRGGEKEAEKLKYYIPDFGYSITSLTYLASRLCYSCYFVLPSLCV